MKNGKWLGFVVLLISLYVLWQIRQVLLLVFMAIVFAVPLNRIVRRLGRAGMKRGLATVISVISLIIFSCSWRASLCRHLSTSHKTWLILSLKG